MKIKLIIINLTILILSLYALLVSAENEMNSSLLEFSLLSSENTLLKLSDFRGRVVILDFFATWCGPCKKYIPKLNALQTTYSNQGLSVIGCLLDKNNQNNIKSQLIRNNIDFPIVIGNIELAKSWGIKVLPTTFIIDPKGQIIKRFEGITENIQIITIIEKYLNKEAPAPPIVKIYKSDQQQQHIRYINFYDNEIVDGQKGLVFVVNADFSNQVIEQGMWIQLNFYPYQTILGEHDKKTKSFYLRIDEPIQEQYALFVRHDQLPSTNENGYYKFWIAIINAQQKIVEKSEEQILQLKKIQNL